MNARFGLLEFFRIDVKQWVFHDGWAKYKWEGLTPCVSIIAGLNSKPKFLTGRYLR
jgi:hypothetical protein